MTKFAFALTLLLTSACFAETTKLSCTSSVGPAVMTKKDVSYKGEFYMNLNYTVPREGVVIELAEEGYGYVFGTYTITKLEPTVEPVEIGGKVCNGGREKGSFTAYYKITGLMKTYLMEEESVSMNCTETVSWESSCE